MVRTACGEACLVEHFFDLLGFAAVVGGDYMDAVAEQPDGSPGELPPQHGGSPAGFAVRTSRIVPRISA